MKGKDDVIDVDAENDLISFAICCTVQARVSFESFKFERAFVDKEFTERFLPQSRCLLSTINARLRRSR